MTNEGITNAQIAERGLICKVFYARGGKTLKQNFVEAKTSGVTADWFSDPVSRVVWLAAEATFAEADGDVVKLINIIIRSKAIAAGRKDPAERDVSVTTESFAAFEKFVSHDDTVASFVRDVRNSLMIRKAEEKINGALLELRSGEDPAKILNGLIRDTQGIINNNSGCHRLSVSDLCDRALADWDEANHQCVELGNYEWCPGEPLPWRKLAYSLNGFTPDVTVLAARPGVGKTSMAINFARYWLDHGRKVAFVSVDMSSIGFIKRQISERAGVSSRKLQFGKSLQYADERKRIVQEIDVLKGLEKSNSFHLLPEYDVDVIKATCSIMKDKGEVDVLVVDYMQLLKFRGSERMTANSKMTYISNTLHELANELQIPVLALSQLNRDNTRDGGRDPQLSDLRDSGAIEQDAANVLLLYRNESLLSKWRDSEPPVQFSRNKSPSPALNAYCPVWCLIAKSREGDGGTKLPFVVVQNKYMWYLGDYEAKGDDQFLRVYDDWRHDPLEQIWMENGSLIRMEDVRAVERVNLNNERRAAGLPEIVWN